MDDCTAGFVKMQIIVTFLARILSDFMQLYYIFLERILIIGHAIHFFLLPFIYPSIFFFCLLATFSSPSQGGQSNTSFALETSASDVWISASMVSSSLIVSPSLVRKITWAPPVKMTHSQHEGGAPLFSCSANFHQIFCHCSFIGSWKPL